MRRFRIRRAAALSLLALLGTSAGLAAQEGDAARRTTEDGVTLIDTTEGLDLDESQTVHIRITNDLVPTRSVVVSVIGGTRPEYVLGAVLSNETKEWIVDSRAFAGGIRILATSGARDVRLSRRIDVMNFASVRWGLGTGIVRVARRAAETR